MQVGTSAAAPWQSFCVQEMARRRRLTDAVDCESAGTNVFAPNSPVHNGTVRQLRRENIPLLPGGSAMLPRRIMGGLTTCWGWNAASGGDGAAAGRRPEGKMRRLLTYTAPADIDDPWYTGGFCDGVPGY